MSDSKEPKTVHARLRLNERFESKLAENPVRSDASPPNDVREFFADWPESMDLALELRELVFAIIPGAQEKVQSGWCMLSLRAGPRHGDTVCWIAPKTWGLHLGFPFGKEVPDPDGLLFALSGKASPARNVRIESSEDITRPALRALIRSAHELV